MSINENCLLLPDVHGFVLPAKPLDIASEPDASSALRYRDPRFLSCPGTLLVQPEIDSAAESGIAVLTVFPSTACNLRCSYCYASSGSLKKELSFQQYQLILQDILRSVRFRRLQLHLHGGGEPTLNPLLFQELVREFAKQCAERQIQPLFSLTTNGTFGNQAWQTIEDFRIAGSVSWDGPDDIQHQQRPFSSGSNSHPVVLRNIRKLVGSNLLKSVRLTVTPFSIDRLPEIIYFLHAEGVTCLHIEPISVVGRQKEQAEPGLSVDRYAHGFQDAYTLCCRLGIQLQGLGMMPFRRSTGRHCGAFGWNFVVTPWGEISACTRVQQKSDEHGESFLLGPWVSVANPFTFASSRRTKLQQRCADNLPDCADCYLRYHCAGGCPLKITASYDAELNRTTDLPCELTKSCSSAVLSAVRQGYLPPGWKTFAKASDAPGRS